MTRPWPGRAIVRIAVVVVLLTVGASACTGGSSADARVKPTGGRVLRYVALGGDDAYGSRNRFTSSWPQELFRSSLPINAVFVNLARPRSGAAEVRVQQVPDAVRLTPDVVTITLLDDLERGTPPEALSADLTAIIRALLRVPGIDVLVGTAPGVTGSPEDRRAFDAAVTAGTKAGGAQLVDLSGVDATTADGRARQIAGAFDAHLQRGHRGAP